MSPLEPPVEVVPPQAKATTVAIQRTTSPRARTIWFPLVFVGRHEQIRQAGCLPSLAALFPTESGRECAGDECGHMGWPNHYSVQNYRLQRTRKSSRDWWRDLDQWVRASINTVVSCCNQRRPPRSR